MSEGLKNVKFLYGFSFFDQFMIVIPLLVPYLGSRGIGMREFMELQAIFALVIVCGELPTGLISDLWGRKKTLLVGSLVKAMGFSLLPLWESFDGFLVYHLTMGVALSLISGGDVAFLYESHLASGAHRSRSTAVLGNAKLAGQTGAAASALLGGAVATLSYDYLPWLNAALSWISVFFVLGLVEPAKGPRPKKPWTISIRELVSAAFLGDRPRRLLFLNIILVGIAGLVMVWTNQRYWQESGVPLAYFGLLYAAYNLVGGLAGRCAGPLQVRFGRGPVVAVAGSLPVIAYFMMASFLGWVGILFGILDRASRGLGDVLYQQALNERISSAFRATVISAANLGIRAAFSVIGPLVGYGIDASGLPTVLVAVGILFGAAFLALILPLAMMEAGLSRNPPSAAG